MRRLKHRMVLLCMLLSSTSGFAQNPQPLDTCACKTLLQLFDIYWAEVNRGVDLDYDSFANAVLGLNDNIANSRLFACNTSFYAGQSKNKNGQTLQKSGPLAFWNATSTAVLEQYSAAYNDYVPYSVSCKKPNSDPLDIADPYTLNMWFEMLFQEKEWGKFFPKKTIGNQSRLLYLHHVLRSNSKLKNKNILKKTAAELNAVFFPTHPKNLDFYIRRALLADVLWRPECLMSVDNSTLLWASNIYFNNTNTSLNALKIKYINWVKKGDTSNIYGLKKALESRLNHCELGYRMPLSWYLYKNNGIQENRIKDGDISFNKDSLFIDAFLNLIEVVNKKPNTDLLYAKSFYLYPSDPHEARNLYGPYRKIDSAIYSGADRSNLKWELQDMEPGEKLFYDGFKTSITDSLGYQMNLQFTLPLRRTRWGIHRIIEFQNPRLIEKRNGNYMLALDLVYMLNNSPNAPEAPETASQYNYIPGGSGAMFYEMMVDFVTVLVEIDFQHK